MKLLTSLCFIIALSSCAGGWTEEDKKTFRNDCIESVRSRLTDQQMNTYCDCFTEEMVKIYPVFNDAMEHRDPAKIDSAQAHCRVAAGLLR